MAELWRLIANGTRFLAQSPGLIIFNLGVGCVVAIVVYFLAYRLLSRVGGVVWLIGLGVLLYATSWFYFPGYDWTGYYKEAEIPESEFAHMVLVKVVWPQPLIAIVAFSMAGITHCIYRWRRPPSN